MTGEYPRPKDDFELFVRMKPSWDAGAAYAGLKSTAADAAKDKLDLALEWRDAHAEAQR